MYHGRGRLFAVTQLKVWLDEYAPADMTQNVTPYYVNRDEKHRRDGRYKKDLKAWATRDARMSKQWIASVAATLELRPNAVKAMTNKIVDIMELALAQGETVFISGFGTFRNRSAGIKFRMDPNWELELNEPTDKSELGLYRRVSKDGDLEYVNDLRLRQLGVLDKRQLGTINNRVRRLRKSS